MISSLYNGMSGIMAHEKAINVEANNSANVNTAGYKSSQISFQDLIYNSTSYEKGHGVSEDLISKKFIQGTITDTGNNFDVAIEGDGYFPVRDKRKNEIFYTRSGDFFKGGDGTLQHTNGMQVLGTPMEQKEIVSTDAKLTTFQRGYDKFITSTTITNKEFLQTINASTTDFRKTAKDISVSGKGFKPRNVVIQDVVNHLADYRAKIELYRGHSTEPYKKSTNQKTKYTFSSLNSGDLARKNTLRIIVNNEEILQKFTKDDDPQVALNTFADKISRKTGMRAVTDGKGSLTIETLIPGDVNFITYPSLNDDNAAETIISKASLGSGQGLLDSSRDALKKALELAGAKFMELRNTIKINTKENIKLNEIQLSPVKLNLYDDEVGVISVEKAGGIYVKNGKNKFLIGKLETTFFRDDNELELVGETLFKETPSSGKPRNAILRDKILPHSLEKSNVELSNTLVSLMTYQRAFEANSKSITTSDEMLKTAINLRK